MAIAGSPAVAPPPLLSGAGPRQVAMSLPHRPAGPLTGFDGAERLARPGLVTTALQLAARAPSWPGMTSPSHRCWDLMAASDAFEAWVIAWPPGGAIELHDHGGSAGAVVVAAGKLLETSVVDQTSGGVALQTTAIAVGRHISFGGRHVHDIVNAGETPAISVHVYAPRLTSMTYYRFTDGVLHARDTIHGQLATAVA
ncbi:MAG TPA: cysteine dioxygenase family protein [Acidimicrobiales bacterium]